MRRTKQDSLYNTLCVELIMTNKSSDDIRLAVFKTVKSIALMTLDEKHMDMFRGHHLYIELTDLQRRA